MTQSVLALVFFFLAGPAAPLLAAPPKVDGVRVKVSVSGLKLAADDIFVAWSDSCTLKSKPSAKLSLDEVEFSYVPKLLVGQVGQALVVRNQDKIKHNSFALKAVAFDSGLQNPGTAYEIKLAKPGVTKVFCRIHPKMVADVLVLNNPCFKEARGGELEGFTLPGAKPGNGKVWLFSPRLRAFHSLSPAGGEAAFALEKKHFLETVSSPDTGRDAGY